MKVFVVGSGAREHAMAWAIARELGGKLRARAARAQVFCIPGNAGTETIAHNIPIDPEDIVSIIEACRDYRPDLVVIGPEGPLAAGLVDALEAEGITVFGPRRKAAALESNKSFARTFSERHGIPCAKTRRLSRASELSSFLDENAGMRIVLKKSGLAAGKGVLESDDRAELARFGEAVLESDLLLAEEFLAGRELSLFALCDRTERIMLPACADHKKAGVGDIGPNTGGMGAVCPVPFADGALLSRIEREIVDPTIRGMEEEGLSYRGVLFFGIMATAEGPKLLEYNVRFGDPETQSLLPLLDSSFLELCSMTAKGGLCSLHPVFSGRIACGVVVAAPGYPGSYPKGLAVNLGQTSQDEMSEGEEPDSLLFHASTARDPEGKTRTGGGRCFTAVGIGPDWKSARERAYGLAGAVRFDGAWSRPDIGRKLYGS